MTRPHRPDRVTLGPDRVGGVLRERQSPVGEHQSGQPEVGVAHDLLDDAAFPEAQHMGFDVDTGPSGRGVAEE